MAVNPNPPPSNVLLALHNDLDKFSSADTDEKLLLRTAANGDGSSWFEMYFFLGSSDPVQSGWRVVTPTSDSAIAADVYTMPRFGDTDCTEVAEGTARLACVRKGWNIAAMLLQVEALKKSFSEDDTAYRVHVVIMPGPLPHVLVLEPPNAEVSARRIVAFHSLSLRLKVGEILTQMQFLELVKPLFARWIADALDVKNPLKYTPKPIKPALLGAPRRLKDFRFPPDQGTRSATVCASSRLARFLSLFRSLT